MWHKMKNGFMFHTAFPIKELEDIFRPDGYVETKLVDKGTELDGLDPKMYDLGMNIKAGTNLEKLV